MRERAASQVYCCMCVFVCVLWRLPRICVSESNPKCRGLLVRSWDQSPWSTDTLSSKGVYQLWLWLHLHLTSTEVLKKTLDVLMFCLLFALKRQAYLELLSIKPMRFYTNVTTSRIDVIEAFFFGRVFVSTSWIMRPIICILSKSHTFPGECRREGKMCILWFPAYNE